MISVLIYRIWVPITMMFCKNRMKSFVVKPLKLAPVSKIENQHNKIEQTSLVITSSSL